MLQRKISASHDVATLIERVRDDLGDAHGGYAALLFTWCIAHQDVAGRMHGDPRLVRATVFPLIEHVTAAHVNVYLRHMHEIGLVHWYEVGDRRWLAFPGFEGSQPGLRKDREPASLAPDPEKGSPVGAGSLPAVSRQDAGSPREVRGAKEEKGKEVEGKRNNPDLPRDEFDFIAVYEAYPRKEGRKKGLQRCKSQITTRSKYDALMRAVANYAATLTDVTFAKHFDTFMGCWEDYADAGLLTPKRVANGTHVGHARPAPHNTETVFHDDF